MFRAADQFVTVTDMKGVRIKDERENDRTHLAEFGFETPLTVELANDISGKLVRELFDKAKDGFTPKAEFSTVTLNLDTGLNRMTVKGAPVPDAEALIAIVENVTLKHVRVSKASNTWMLSWVAQFPLDIKAVAGLIAQLKQSVYVTFERQNPKLGGLETTEASDTAADEGDAEVEHARQTARRGGRRRAATTDSDAA